MRARWIAVATLLLAPSLALAQHVSTGEGSQISYGAILKAPAGRWAEYEVKVWHVPRALRLRYALVKKEAKLITLEVTSETVAKGDLIVRMDFTPAPKTKGVWTLTRTIMKLADQDPEEVPPPPSTTLAPGPLGEVLAAQKLPTPLGQLACKHYRQPSPEGTVELWTNDKVFPTGLVKKSDPRTTVVLTNVGSGATAQLIAP